MQPEVLPLQGNHNYYLVYTTPSCKRVKRSGLTGYSKLRQTRISAQTYHSLTSIFVGTTLQSAARMHCASDKTYVKYQTWLRKTRTWHKYERNLRAIWSQIPLIPLWSVRRFTSVRMLRATAQYIFPALTWPRIDSNDRHGLLATKTLFICRFMSCFWGHLYFNNSWNDSVWNDKKVHRNVASASFRKRWHGKVTFI